MKRHAALTAALVATLATLVATACRHDSGEVTLTLHSETLGDHGKMAVDDRTTLWSDGDTLWVNGTRYGISVGGNGQVQTMVAAADRYNAIFPASVVTSAGTVCLPAEYHYATDGNGRQRLDMPMAASSEGANLMFYHITAAVIVKYVNHRSSAVEVDRITVTSDRYALCGNRSIAFGDTTQTALASGNPAERSVTMLFDRQQTLLAAGDTLAVMLPMAPVGSDNHFTVEVSSHIEGNRYTVSNTQQTARPLLRNKLGYAYMVEENSSAKCLFEILDPNEEIKTLIINSAKDLLLMQQAINGRWSKEGDAHNYSEYSYKLGCDIDMQGITIAPISGMQGSFFIGDTHKISNLTISSSGAICALFDTIKTTEIVNLKLDNVTLISNGNATPRYISPLIGRLSSATAVTNCTTSVATVNSTAAAVVYGGIAAINSVAATINYCSASTNCTINNATAITFGGLVGDAGNNITCTSCSTNNNVHLVSTGKLYAGGAIGNGKSRDLSLNGTSCLINMVTHNASGNHHVGGMVGNLSSDNSGQLKVVDNSSVGGRITTTTSGTGPIYVGTIYGRGRSASVYGGWSYTSNLTIPANGGTIISGDPTGRY